LLRLFHPVFQAALEPLQNRHGATAHLNQFSKTLQGSLQSNCKHQTPSEVMTLEKSFTGDLGQVKLPGACHLIDAG
jgi:hypothetical protein